MGLKPEVRPPRTVDDAAGLRITVLDEDDAGACVSLELAAFVPIDRFPASVWRRFLGPCQQRGTALAIGVRGPRGMLAAAAIVLLRRTSRVARIYSLAVDPAWRGRGLGGRLVESAAHRLRGRCATISLEVRVDNAAARALYERLGFTAGETLPDYYADGEHGLRYRRAIGRRRMRA